MSEKSSNKTAAAGGTGLMTLLQVAFIVLKLCKVIDWSWWWVLAPTWFPIALLIIIAIIIAFIPGKK